MTRTARAAVAGASAAALWGVSEPLLRRACRTSFSDVRLAGAFAGRLWPAAGLAIHCANGAVFGVAFERMGGSGWRQGVLAAEAENLVLWPGMALVDRFHPDVRAGRWPRMLRDRRVFAQEVAAHALFGAVLGAALRRR